MLEAIFGAVAGVLVTALVTYIVRSYKNVILYETRSHSVRFRLNEREVVHSNDYSSPEICLDSLKLRNKGYRDLSDVELHWRMNNSIFRIEVTNTKTISPNAIDVTPQDKYVAIKIRHLPKGEELEIDIFSNGHDHGWTKVDGTGGAYRVEKENSYLSAESVASYGFFGFIIGLSAIGAALLLAHVSSEKASSKSPPANSIDVQSVPPPKR
ncbi:hypothetical protein O4H52_09915 [Sphingomonadaceae bacterium G21617-S1]|nr:hypothetical protein [Sphingomonadaceae bacterium G21617-S1]